MPDDDHRRTSPGPRARTLPDPAWTPLAVGTLLGAVGLVAWGTGRPWLFPSLGPSAYLQAEEPDKPASRFFNTVVGHLVGFAAGSLAVFLLGAAQDPSSLADKQVTAARAGAAALSGMLTMAGLSAPKASHPPAAATMLLVALGGFRPNWADAGSVLAGVLILATLGEAVRYVRRNLLVPPAL